MKIISLLQNWFELEVSQNCSTFLLETLDNPGWSIEVCSKVKRTNIEISHNSDDDDWIFIQANSTDFKGYCGHKHFQFLCINLFSWLYNKNYEKELEQSNFINFLQKWFNNKFIILNSEDWEFEHHGYGMKLASDKNGWILEVDDEFDKKPMLINNYVNKSNYCKFQANTNQFILSCSNNNLTKLIDYFIKWEENLA